MYKWKKLNHNLFNYLSSQNEIWIKSNVASAMGCDLPSSWLEYKNYLINLQNEDGGFPLYFKLRNPSGVHQTAYAIWFHLTLDQNPPPKAIKRGLDFICHQQDRSGGWKEREEIIRYLPLKQQKEKVYWPFRSVFPPVPFDVPNVYFTAWIGKVCRTYGLCGDILNSVPGYDGKRA